MTLNDIAGRWDIVSWRQAYDDGRIAYPMGEQLRGFIEYGPHGMFCVIETSERAKFASASQWAAPDADKARAYDGYFSYAGDYSLEGDTVVHRVRHSLFPNWEGGTQRRTARFADGLLHLTARLEDGTGEARTASLVWRRAESASVT